MRKLAFGTFVALLAVAMLWAPVAPWMYYLGFPVAVMGCYWALIGQRELGGPL